jgi:broad specificity phosphatase PhoE
VATSARDHSGMRIILIRHGRPAIEMDAPLGFREFRRFIDAYEAASLDPESRPPEQLRDLTCRLPRLITSSRPRAQDSARTLAPQAELLVEPLFVEAPLAGPRIPLVKMRAPAWAVLARLLWRLGYSPGVEGHAAARRRAALAADLLLDRARNDGVVVVMAHGWLNLMIGRELAKRGLRRCGAHQAQFWNAVTYAYA